MLEDNMKLLSQCAQTNQFHLSLDLFYPFIYTVSNVLIKSSHLATLTTPLRNKQLLILIPHSSTNHLSSSFSHPRLRAGRGQRGTPFVPADHLCSGLLPQAHGGAQRPETRERPPGRQHERQDRRLRYTVKSALFV